MDELLNTVNDVQGEVVDAPAETGGETAEAQSPAPESAEPEASARQTPEQNRWFAEQRRAVEAARAEAQRAKSDSDRLMQALRSYGYEGAPQEIADRVEAAGKRITVEQLRAGRLIERQQRRQAVQSAPEYVQARQELDSLRHVVHQGVYDRDLSEIKKSFPDVTAQNIRELGGQYWALRRSGVSNLVAYGAVRQAQDAARTAGPPDIGAVSRAGGAQKDFYTPQEVDRLTAGQLGDPGVLRAVQTSMTKWR